MPQKQAPETFFAKNAALVHEQYKGLADQQLAGALETTQRLIDTMKGAIEGTKLRVLELGCGTGELANHLARTNPDIEVVAVTPFSGELETAKSEYGNTPNLRFEQAGFGDLKNTFGSGDLTKAFDLILSNNALQYLFEPKDREGALTDAASVLKKTGAMILRYPVEPTRTSVNSCHETPRQFLETLDRANSATPNPLQLLEYKLTGNFTHSATAAETSGESCAAPPKDGCAAPAAGGCAGNAGARTTHEFVLGL